MRVVLGLCLRWSRLSGICWVSQVSGEKEGHGTNVWQWFAYVWSKVYIYSSRNSLDNTIFYCAIAFYFLCSFPTSLSLPLLLTHLIAPFSFLSPPLFLFSTSPSNLPLSHSFLFLFSFSSVPFSHELCLLLLPLIYPFLWHPPPLFSLQVLCHLLPAFGL